MSWPFRQHERGCLLDIRLSPGASKDGFEGFFTDADGVCRLKVRVTAVPEKGKANAALVKLLSKSIKYAKGNFEILAGKQDRNKTLLIEGAPEEISRRLEDWIKTLWPAGSVRGDA